MPRRCLYDNAKAITLGRDEEKRPVWNERMLDFALRVGFELRLCQPYRAQTKGKVESGVKYVRRNMWPSMRFTDDADLNRQGLGGFRAAAQRWNNAAALASFRVPGEPTVSPFQRAERIRADERSSSALNCNRHAANYAMARAGTAVRSAECR